MAKSPTQEFHDEEHARYQAARADPYLGAVVNFVDPDMGDILPGMVTMVLSNGKVHITAFPPGVTPYPVRPVVERSVPPTNAGPFAKGTWHWRT